MSGHTPGPWAEDAKHTGGARAVIGDGQQLVALVYGRAREEQSANARLIAAAPDLLAALDELLDSFEIATDNFSEIEFRGVMFPPYRVSEFIRAVMAKAEGQANEVSGSP